MLPTIRNPPDCLFFEPYGGGDCMPRLSSMAKTVEFGRTRLSGRSGPHSRTSPAPHRQESLAADFPSHASALSAGCSTLYHLADLGVTDAVLLERNKLTSGTTWHSTAQVRALRSTRNLTDLIIDLALHAARGDGSGDGMDQQGLAVHRNE